MKYLNAICLIWLTIGCISLSSCGDDCTAPDISTNIVGVWNPVLSGGEVEFKADGTYTDDTGALLSIGMSSADDVRTYTIEEMTLTMNVDAADGSGFISVDFEVTQNECDQIKISLLGLEETLNRK